MSGYFNTFDYVFMVFYFAVLIMIGLYLKRRASASLENYIVGGNQIPWWALGVAGMGNYLDLAGTAMIVSFLFLLGPRGLFIELRGGVCLVLSFMMLWTGKWHRRSGCLTAAEWNIFRFGDTWGGRFAQMSAVIAGIVGTVGMTSYLIFGAGQFLATFLPFSPMTCAVVLIAVASIYTMLSGFYGVVFTDLFQSMIIITAVIYIAVSAFLKVGSPGELETLAVQVTGNRDWMTASAQWFTSMPDGYKMYQHLALFSFFYVLRISFQGLGSGADPKFFGARNDRECGKLACLWTVLMTFRWPLMMGVVVLGIYLVSSLLPDAAVVHQAAQLIRQYNPDAEQSGWGALISKIINSPENFSPEMVSGLKSLLGTDHFTEKINLLGFNGFVNPERILPAVLLFCMMPGLRGLVLIALIAACLTTFSSSINMTSGMMVRDLYQKYIRPQALTKELVFAGWISVLLLVLCSFYFAYSIKSINDIWSWIVMGLGAGLLAPGILRFYWWRFNGGGYAIGTFFGLIAAVLQRLLDPDMQKFWFFRIIPEYNEIVLFLFIFAIGTLGCVLGTFLSRPTAENVLKDFYVKTRPFGIWGRMKDALPSGERETVSREHRNDLLALPFAMLWQVAMYMMMTLLITHNWPALGIWAILFIIGLGGVHRFWYRNLPAENLYE